VLYLFLLAVVLAIRGDLPRPHEGAGAARRARLIVLEPGQTGLEPGAALPLQPVTRLGRSGTSTIVLEDTYVSSDHARIEYRDGAWWLADQGSTNGTMLNDRPVTDATALESGDVIAIGQVRLKVS